MNWKLYIIVSTLYFLGVLMITMVIEKNILFFGITWYLEMNSHGVYHLFLTSSATTKILDN